MTDLVYFQNRLAKNAKHLRKWAGRNQVHAYRLYDCDIPEFPLIVDLYDTESGPRIHLQEALSAKGCTDGESKALVLPMQKLHALRTAVCGHATTDKKRKAESEARTTFGTLRAHFTHLVTDCDRALNEILRMLAVNLKS